MKKMVLTFVAIMIAMILAPQVMASTDVYDRPMTFPQAPEAVWVDGNILEITRRFRTRARSFFSLEAPFFLPLCNCVFEGHRPEIPVPFNTKSERPLDAFQFVKGHISKLTTTRTEFSPTEEKALFRIILSNEPSSVCARVEKLCLRNSFHPFSVL